MSSMNTHVLSLATIMALGACGGAQGGSQDDAGATSGDHFDVVGEYELQPGEEKYYCYAINMPADPAWAIKRLVPTYGPGTHHILFSQALAKEPDGFSECTVLTKNTWVPMYAAGIDSGPLSPPEGSALKLLFKGQQVVLQLHLQNPTAKPIKARTTMRMELVAADTPGLTPAGIFGLDNRIIDIPMGAKDVTSTMDCVIPKDLDVFAVLGHMHKSGKKLDLYRITNAGNESLYTENWNFDEQPVSPLAIKIKAGDRIGLRCVHDNMLGKAIGYGESSDNEMCAAVFYYTPYDAIDGCIQE